MAYQIKTRTREYRRSTPVLDTDTGERERAWLKVWGMWRQKKPDPIHVIRKLRKELDRTIG